MAKILTFLDKKTELISINTKSNIKKIIKKNGIIFKKLNNEINERYYSSLLDKNGKMILGLANMDIYEKSLDLSMLQNQKNQNILLDLNFSENTIKNLINKYCNNNYICVCGTSAHKVKKISSYLNKINTLILNKEESLHLTGKLSIKESLKDLIKSNNKLNIIITNGKNSVHGYKNKKTYICTVPKIKVRNENGAGDALSAYFNYFYCNSLNMKDSLTMSVVAGALKASGYNNNKKKYLQKIIRLSKGIKVKISNYNV
jgi:pseudouridine kinase